MQLEAEMLGLVSYNRYWLSGCGRRNNVFQVRSLVPILGQLASNRLPKCSANSSREWVGKPAHGTVAKLVDADR